MKNFNLFFALLIITGLSVLIHSCTKESTEKIVNLSSQDIQTETRTSYCDGSGGKCSNAFNNKTATITGIPSYPYCTFEVFYMIRECTAGADIIYVDLAYHFMDPGCSDFDMDTNGPNANNVIDQVIRELINVIIETEGFDLAEPCGSPEGPKYITFFQSTCSKRCLMEERGKDGVIIRRFISIPCGQGCCKTILTVCYDNNNYLNTEVVSEPSAVTICPPQPQLTCPDDTIREGECRPSCLQIKTGG